MKQVLDIRQLAPNIDSMAVEIGSLWERWKQDRSKFEVEILEVRDYVFATDTSQTTNKKTPWKNSTTLPKLCQIRDNLHANYMDALFPNEDWLTWKAADESAALKEKADIIKAYIKNKFHETNGETVIAQTVLDWIDTGNAFAEVVVDRQFHLTPDEEIVPKKVGPSIERISLHDITFDITAPSFEDANKVRRRFLTLGQLAKHVNAYADSGWSLEALRRITELRRAATGYAADRRKLQGLKVDGFSNPYSYLTSGSVEILEFEGDYYDLETDTLYENRRIVVADRLFVLLNEPFTSWFGKSNKVHVGWRLRPDNLMAQGPLANLVGMQYRIDHLENLKADVFDVIAWPVVYQKGMVEDWEWGPGARIFGDVESDVKILAPDTLALNAETEIHLLMERMEELAGAPKQAMGIRTPGEKTAFEVQQLENGAGRIFQNKIRYFERNFLEKLLNIMLEAGRRNFPLTEAVPITDDTYGATEFRTILKEDIQAQGTLLAMGARHFARKAQMIQNLTTLANSPVYADPAVQVHISGKKLAELVAEFLDVDKYGLVQDNVRLFEQVETQQAMQTAEAQLLDHQQAGAEIAGMEAEALEEEMMVEDEEDEFEE